MNYDKSIILVNESIEVCKKLSQNSDWYDTYERREKYNKAQRKIQELNDVLLHCGILELKSIEFDNPFDNFEKFIINEGWTIDEFKDIDDMDIVERYGEARHGSAVAMSELNHVEHEPMSDSRPYSIAAECAKEQLENSKNQLKIISK